MRAVTLFPYIIYIYICITTYFKQKKFKTHVLSHPLQNTANEFLHLKTNKWWLPDTSFPVSLRQHILPQWHEPVGTLFALQTTITSITRNKETTVQLQIKLVDVLHYCCNSKPNAKALRLQPRAIQGLRQVRRSIW